jgi:hypothetical protein
MIDRIGDVFDRWLGFISKLKYLIPFLFIVGLIIDDLYWRNRYYRQKEEIDRILLEAYKHDQQMDVLRKIY